MPAIDAYATEKHFLEHIAPAWLALPESARGVLTVPRPLLPTARALDIENVRVGYALGMNRAHVPVLVASWGDLVRSRPRSVVFMEHGAGQTYEPQHRSYAGGFGRERVSLFLCPSERVAAINRAAYPDARVDVVGCPMLDRWHGRDYPRHDPPVVAISFHWDARLFPEARTAFPHYQGVLGELASQPDFRVIGHGHPRIIRRLAPTFRAEGIEVVSDFDQVLERADLYACDNSSSLFMFASTGRPVVVMNAPWYRRNVDWGLRFWDAADVGYQVDEPDEVVPMIRDALVDPPAQRQRREEIVAGIYAHRDGTAAQSAADAITDWLGSREARVAA